MLDKERFLISAHNVHCALLIASIAQLIVNNIFTTTETHAVQAIAPANVGLFFTRHSTKFHHLKFVVDQFPRPSIASNLIVLKRANDHCAS